MLDPFTVASNNEKQLQVSLIFTLIVTTVLFFKDDSYK